MVTESYFTDQLINCVRKCTTVIKSHSRYQFYYRVTAVLLDPPTAPTGPKGPEVYTKTSVTNGVFRRRPEFSFF